MGLGVTEALVRQELEQSTGHSTVERLFREQVLERSEAIGAAPQGVDQQAVLTADVEPPQHLLLGREWAILAASLFPSFPTALAPASTPALAAARISILTTTTRASASASAPASVREMGAVLVLLPEPSVLQGFNGSSSC